ncbi:MAG TPA: hypothetical protein VJ454_05485, partial [Steroidobacteraceae bacterium]|nr:hypothetical protein [Steroidobacteraceae bacterium]
MTRQRRCRICHERPPWHGKNCPPGICNVVITRRSGSTGRRHAPRAFRAECAASTDPFAYVAGQLVYDGHLDAFRPAGLFRRLGRVEAALVAYEVAIERTENAEQ